MVLCGKAAAGARIRRVERSMWLLPSHWAHFGTRSSPPPNPQRTDASQPVPRGCGLGVVKEGSVDVLLMGTE